MKIYVSNLGFDVQDNQLHDLFATYGEVVSAKVILDRETRRSRGFGFVEMTNEQDGKNAIQELNDQELNGRNISVTVAREKPQFDNNRGGGGGFNRSSSSGRSDRSSGGGFNKRW